jgi:TIR domain
MPSFNIFLSYSHQDEPLKDQLNVFLAPLRRNGKIAVWHDHQILPGQEWDAAIKQELTEADIILLLVSPHFLASDYIWQHEISKAMERHERRETTVVPIILKPCDWTEMPFAKLQALPRNAKPVTQHTDQDEAFMDVVKGIKRVLEA